MGRKGPGMQMVPPECLQNQNPFKAFPVCCSQRGSLLPDPWQLWQSTVLAGVAREDEFPWKGDEWRILRGKLRLLLKVRHFHFPLVRKKVTIGQWSVWFPVSYSVNP